MHSVHVPSELEKKDKVDPEVRNQKLDEGRRHMEFMCEIYKYQVRRKKLFLHEHPWSAKSWKEPCIREVHCLPGVALYKADQCMYGLKTTDAEGAAVAAMKPIERDRDTAEHQMRLKARA